MTQHDIDFIRSRWAGRACGSDVQKLVNEIARLSEIVSVQTDTIEGEMWDKLETERGELLGEIEVLKNDAIEDRAYRDDLIDEILRLNEKLS